MSVLLNLVGSAATAPAVVAASFDGFININPTTIICTLLNTLIMFLILRHFLFGRVNKMLEERQNQVESVYKDADQSKLDAEGLKEEYSTKLLTVKAESTEIVNAATARARTKSDEIIFSAKEQAAQIVTKANADVEREHNRVMNQMKDEISSIAMAVAERVVEKELTDADNDRLIEGFIQEMGNVK